MFIRLFQYRVALGFKILLVVSFMLILLYGPALPTHIGHRSKRSQKNLDLSLGQSIPEIPMTVKEERAKAEFGQEHERDPDLVESMATETISSALETGNDTTTYMDSSISRNHVDKLEQVQEIHDDP